MTEQSVSAPAKDEAELTPPAERAWRFSAWISGAFSLLLGVAMLVGHLQSKAEDPLKSPELKEAKNKLRLDPADAPLKRHIEELDLQLRQRYFRQLAQRGSGVYLLLGALTVLIISVTRVNRFRKQLPMPKLNTDGAEKTARETKLARWSVAASGAAMGVLLFLLSLSMTKALPKIATEKLLVNPSPIGGAPQVASLDELRQGWPRFRGADGGGVAFSTNAPLNWDAASGTGIVWKVTAPASGFGSPVVWGDHVFFSGGDARQREVICLDARTGQMQWRHAVAPANAGPPVEIPESTGYAAATVATDGRRVYAIFATGELVAFTLEGQPVWSKNFGPLKNAYGHASSLATWRDRLIVQLDQGDSDAGKSRLYALDGRTGEIAWQRPRKVPDSWASPIIIEAAGKAQIITLAIPWVIANAAADGAELWRVECLNGEITPSPIFAAGLVIAASPSDKLLAIRPDGQGDVSKTHVAWKYEENVPDITSPVSNGELVFTLSTSGMLTCLDVKDGKKQWEHDFDTEFHASPSIAGNRLYLFAQKGLAVVVEVARQFKEISRMEIGDAIHASPAFAQDRIFLRGLTNVWCLGQGEIRNSNAEIRSKSQ